MPDYDDLKTVACKRLEIILSIEEDGMPRIPSENYWEFGFFVKKEDANRILYSAVDCIAPYRFKQMKIGFGKDNYILEQFVWDDNMIRACLNANLSNALKRDDDEGMKLTQQ